MCVNVYGSVKTEKRIMTYIDYSHDNPLARTYHHQTGDTKQADKEISQDYELQNRFPSFFMFTAKEKCTLVFLCNYFLGDRNQKAVKRLKSSIIWTYYTALMLMVLEINSDMKKPNWNGTWSPGLNMLQKWKREAGPCLGRAFSSGRGNKLSLMDDYSKRQGEEIQPDCDLSESGLGDILFPLALFYST